MSNMPQRSSPLIVVCNMPVAWIGYSWQWRRAGLTVCFPSNPLPLWGRVIVMCAGSLRHAQTLLLLKREIEREKIGDKVGWSGQFFCKSPAELFLLNYCMSLELNDNSCDIACCTPRLRQHFFVVASFFSFHLMKRSAIHKKGLVIKHHWVAPWLSQPKKSILIFSRISLFIYRSTRLNLLRLLALVVFSATLGWVLFLVPLGPQCTMYHVPSQGRRLSPRGFMMEWEQ